MFRELALRKNPELSGPVDLATLGGIANGLASRAVFADYQARVSGNTNRRHARDLALFAEFLRSVGVVVGDLHNSPDAWLGVTWGLVAAFQAWQVGRGYAIGAVNGRVAAVKKYAELAHKADVLGHSEAALIKAVEGYSYREGVRLDEKRKAAGVDVRQSTKKAAAVRLDDALAGVLKRQDDLQDRLIMCLLLDHGMRCGELAALQPEDFDLAVGVLRFYRSKTSKAAVHKLSSDALAAALAYVPGRVGLPLFVGKRGKAAAGDDGINYRVGEIGKAAGVPGLSPHDCRHYCATRQAGRKNLAELMEFFGWSSPAMAARYIHAGEVCAAD